MKNKDGKNAVFSHVSTTFSHVVVKSLDNSLNARTYLMTDDVSYAFGRFLDFLKKERLVAAVKKVSRGEVLNLIISSLLVFLSFKIRQY